MGNQNQHPEGESQDVPEAPAAPRSARRPPPRREFIAEVDCIYNGGYVSAGTRVTAEAEHIPHFRRA
jgi:hypothetical protein